MPLSKRLFKICEAVRLGLEYYYIGNKDRRKDLDAYMEAHLVMTSYELRRAC